MMKATAKIIFYLSIVIFVLSLSSVLFAQDTKGVQPPDGKSDQTTKVTEPNSKPEIVEKKDNKIYISANLGYAMAQNTDTTIGTSSGAIEYEPGFAGAAAVGFGFDYGRAEAEISYQRNGLDKVRVSGSVLDASGDISNLALLFNGYLELFKIENVVTPYLTAGMGVAMVDISGLPVKSGDSYTTDSHKDTVFAYQFGAGVGYTVSEKLTIDLKYRYFQTSDLTFGNTIASYGSHNFYLGVRYTF
jgi:opacity protein-like surface antigen